MAKGRLVLISTKRLGGGPDAWELFSVAIDDDARAIAEIKRSQKTTSDEEVSIIRHLSEDEVRHLGLKEDEIENYLEP